MRVFSWRGTIPKLSSPLWIFAATRIGQLFRKQTRPVYPHEQRTLKAEPSGSGSMAVRLVIDQLEEITKDLRRNLVNTAVHESGLAGATVPCDKKRAPRHLLSDVSPKFAFEYVKSVRSDKMLPSWKRPNEVLGQNDGSSISSRRSAIIIPLTASLASLARDRFMLWCNEFLRGD